MTTRSLNSQILVPFKRSIVVTFALMFFVAVSGTKFEVYAAQTAPSAQPESTAQQGGIQNQQYTNGRSPRSADIVTDNLDRVAATAPEILDALTHEVGLMVEFKRLLAQDAGANGQILDEADLSDDSIAERLSTDLHSRVLATRLLQRYGYLLPKVNPDSDLALEHRLLLQQRANALSKAAEAGVETRTASRPALAAGCSLQGEQNCEPGGIESRGENPRVDTLTPENPTGEY